MDNYIIKTLAYNKQVRILFVDNTDMIREICNQSNMNKLLKTALGTTVSIASLISGILKGNQRISLKVNASNRNYKIFADVDSSGNVRGYISDELLNASLDYANNLSIEQLIGAKGCIQVMQDLGMNNIFTGITDMPYGNIVDDFSYYFRQSVQTPSLFSINIIYNEKNEIVLSRGVFAQLLPDAPIHLIGDIRKIISDHEWLLFNPDNNIAFKEIPNSLFKDIEMIGLNPIQFFCGCSKEIFYPMLYSLKKEELVDAHKNNKPIEIVCNVCGKKYSFNKNEIPSFHNNIE
jgi:molecular chaperone Hsp33